MADTRRWQRRLGGSKVHDDDIIHGLACPEGADVRLDTLNDGPQTVVDLRDRVVCEVFDRIAGVDRGARLQRFRDVEQVFLQGLDQFEIERPAALVDLVGAVPEVALPHVVATESHRIEARQFQCGELGAIRDQPGVGHQPASNGSGSDDHRRADATKGADRPDTEGFDHNVSLLGSMTREGSRSIP